MKNFFYLLVCLPFMACQSNQPSSQDTEDVDAPSTPAVNAAVYNLFDEVNILKMHVFSTLEEDPDAENYPYTGTQFGEDLLPFLPDGIQPNEAGGVFACYRVENNNLYVLRIPGQNISSDLILCRWNDAAGKLEKITDLANYRCEGDNCIQQDAWLADLDDDRVYELITAKMSYGANGKLMGDENFSVFSQDAEGRFVPASELIASLVISGNYKMHQMD